MTITTPLAPAVNTRTYPVIEIFGPTIQGEGAEAGLATHFVRVGGCDYRCSWCDTMYAVDPITVRATARQLTGEQIIRELATMSGHPEWVTISGGNPALHELGPVVDGLHGAGYRVSVETQGSRWRGWLASVDRLTISPKPPSSEMATSRHATEFAHFMDAAMTAVADRAALKIVCFNDVDFDWAIETAARYPDLPLYLSAGTPVPAPPGLRDAIGERYKWLCERVAETPALSRARVFPQLHVIAWKDATGV